MTGRVGAGGTAGVGPDPRLRGGGQRRAAAAGRPGLRACRRTWTAPAPAVPRLAGGVDPTGFGTPLMAGYAADPVNTALGNFVEVETDLAVLRPARRADLRPDLQLLLGRAGPVRGALVVVGDHPPGRRHLDRRVRRPGRPADLLPAGRTGFDSGAWPVRCPDRAAPVRTRLDAGLVRRAPLGVRRGRPGAPDLGRVRVPASAFRYDEDGRLVELAHERGPPGAVRLGPRRAGSSQ